MNQSSDYIKSLIKKQLEGKASADEVKMLLILSELYDPEEMEALLKEIEPDIVPGNYPHASIQPPPFEKIREPINQPAIAIRSGIGNRFGRIVPYAAALGLIFFLWFFNRPQALQYVCGDSSSNPETPTGGYSCSLKLANGCSILIDSTYKGSITRQADMDIIRRPSGELEYKPSLTQKSDNPGSLYNSVTTASGNQYQIILPDGSMVRLNAASSIRFPVPFTKTERVVELKGEAYFDVMPDRNAPFYVVANETRIKALGTGFNVSAYEANTVATLINGDLEIKNRNQIVRLMPGQQAIAPAKPGTKLVLIEHADTSGIASWKRTMRVYRNTPVKNFLSDMGRWYNLEMENLDCVTDRSISVSLCYRTPLPEMLRLLRRSGLEFRLDGRKIIFCQPG